MSARYEISEGELDVLAITGPEGTRYIDGEEIEARAIRQQARDIAELRAELVAALKDLLDDVCEREDVDSPSCNPGRQSAVKWARAALAKAGWQ